MQIITPSKSRAEQSAYRQLNPEIRAAFLAWVEANRQFTRAQVGGMLGYPDGTAVSKYISDKYDRDPEDIEGKIADLLKRDSLRRSFNSELILTNVVRGFAAFADKVTNTNTVGVLTGEAGIGKTRAAHHYASTHPTTVLITVNPAQKDERGVRQLIWSAIDHRGCKWDEPRFDFLVRKFRGTNRLFIVDGAQYLGAGGRSLLYTFHDATGCPILLVGNPCILEQVAINDQEHSRTIQEQTASLKNVEDVTLAFLRQQVARPEEILDLAVQVVDQPRGGHLRALEKLLVCTKDLMELPANRDNLRGSFLKSCAKSVAHKHIAA